MRRLLNLNRTCLCGICIIPALRFRRRELINGNITEEQLAAMLSHQIDPFDGALIETRIVLLSVTVNSPLRF